MNIDEIEIGFLENGLKYYIYENLIDKDRVLLALVVKVGSLMEEKNQVGIAHFTEHMCIYNSNFLYKNETNTEVENINSLSGYTNFEETVYYLDCLVKDIEDGLIALKDIITGQNLIRNSMQSIKDELKYEITIKKKQIEYKLQQSIISKLVECEDIKSRFPIGNIECINNLQFEDVKNFHQKWYLINNSALFIIGAVDKYSIKKMLNNIFLPISTKELPEPLLKVCNMTSKSILINTEKRLKYNEMQIYFPIKDKYSKQANSLNNRILQCFGLSLIKKFIRQRMALHDIEFNNIVFVPQQLLSNLEFNILQLKIKNNFIYNVKFVFKVLREIVMKSVPKNFFIEYKEEFLNQLKIDYIRNQQVDNKVILTECINNYLYNDALLSIEFEYNMFCNIITNISYDDFSLILNDILNCEKLLVSLNLNTVFETTENIDFIKKICDSNFNFFTGA